MRHSLKPRAAADIRRLYEYGVETFGTEQAERYARALDRTFEFLAQNPHIARLRPEIRPPARAYRFKAHVIIYDLGPDDRVIILRVAHGRSDWINNPL